MIMNSHTAHPQSVMARFMRATHGWKSANAMNNKIQPIENPWVARMKRAMTRWWR